MKLRILIADDEQLERRALHRILSTIKGRDLELLEAANGRQAVELVKETPVDLAFLDIRMPGMDGLLAAQEIKSLFPDTRVVFVTAFGQFDYAREAIRMGVDEYLVKPAAPEEVLGTAMRMIGHIEDQRLVSMAGIRSGRDGEQVLELLKEELRTDLGRSDMDSRRLFSFFGLKGLSRSGLVSLIIRLVPAGTDEPAVRSLLLRRISDLAENRFTAAGWHCLLQAGDVELCCAAALSAADPAEVDHVPAAVSGVLEQLAQDFQVNPGCRVIMGVCYLAQADVFKPFATARDALALARPDNPVVLLTPAGTAADGVGINRHGASTVERALAYMHAHLAENLSLTDVAAAVGSAPSHLSRLFSRQGGDTFVHVFGRLRIAAARDLLRSGRYRVKEVCSMVGFHDPAYFSRVFRKYAGMSPVDFQRETGV